MQTDIERIKSVFDKILIKYNQNELKYTEEEQYTTSVSGDYLHDYLNSILPNRYVVLTDNPINYDYFLKLVRRDASLLTTILNYENKLNSSTIDKFVKLTPNTHQQYANHKRHKFFEKDQSLNNSDEIGYINDSYKMDFQFISTEHNSSRSDSFKECSRKGSSENINPSRKSSSADEEYELISLEITATRKQQDSFYSSFVEYRIESVWKSQTSGKVKNLYVYHRYSDFEKLYDLLHTRNPGLIISALPDKKYFNKNDSEVISHRKRHLGDWLQGLLTHVKLRSDSTLAIFLEHSGGSKEFRAVIKQDKPSTLSRFSGNNFINSALDNFSVLSSGNVDELEVYHLGDLRQVNTLGQEAASSLKAAMEDLKKIKKVCTQFGKLVRSYQGNVERYADIEAKLDKLSQDEAHSKTLSDFAAPARDKFSRLTESLAILLEKHLWDAANSSIDFLHGNQKNIEGILSSISIRKDKVHELRLVDKSVRRRSKEDSPVKTDPMEAEELRVQKIEQKKLEDELESSKQDLQQEIAAVVEYRLQRTTRMWQCFAELDKYLRTELLFGESASLTQSGTGSGSTAAVSNLSSTRSISNKVDKLPNQDYLLLTE